MRRSSAEHGLCTEPAAPALSQPSQPSNPSEPSGGANSALAGLDEVYRHEAPRLARYFRRHVRGHEDVFDLVHEAFTRLAGVMAQRPVASPAPYLQRIARNLLFDQAKRPEIRSTSLHVPIGEKCEPAAMPDQGHQIEADDVMRIYRQALGELPVKTREVFLLHRIEECTYKDIGKRLGISIPTVQYHVARALAHIDAALGQE